MEYYSPAWAPYYHKDKDIIERIQDRFTNMITEIKGMEYSDRLEYLGFRDIQVSGSQTRTEMISFSKTHTGTNTEKISKTETI